MFAFFNLHYSGSRYHRRNSWERGCDKCDGGYSKRPCKGRYTCDGEKRDGRRSYSPRRRSYSPRRRSYPIERRSYSPARVLTKIEKCLRYNDDKKKCEENDCNYDKNTGKCTNYKAAIPENVVVNNEPSAEMST